ncbi:MAG: glycosyltransferase family 4 protein [Ignavibacteriales bacterium]|nr:glycosyltransferase family 4 protein [Ignavibacteriales bacterium]
MTVAFLGYFRTSFLRPFIPEISDEDERRFPGMGGHGVTDLTVELIRAGIPLTVITLDPQADTIRRWSHGSIRYIVVPMRKSGVLRDFFRREVKLLLQILREESPEVVHAHWTYAFALAAVKSSFPSLVTLHDHPWDIVKYGGWYNLPGYLTTLYVYRKGNHFAAVAPSVKQFAELHGAREIELIPNVLERTFLFDTKLPDDQAMPPVIVSVLNWTSLKNATTALLSFHGILTEFPDARFDLYGWNLGVGEPGELWARDHGVSQNVVFHGTTENTEVRRAIAASTVVLHPSYTESTSIVIAEAMAMGKPVVAGESAGAVPWVLDNGTCGLLTDVRSVEKVRNSLLALLRNSALRSSMGARGRKRAQTLFNPDNAVRAYSALYERIAGERKI